MTTLLEQAIDTAQSLSPDAQDDIARLMLAYAGDLPVVDLSAEDEAAVLRSREAALRGEVATDEHMNAIWAKHGL